MPEMNGIDLASKILGTGCNAALILLTSNVQKSILDEANEVVSKPY